MIYLLYRTTTKKKTLSNMELTAFDIETFDKIQKLCVPNKWYNFKNDRPDFAQLCNSVVKFSELYGIVEFQEHPDRFKYRIVLKENVVEKKLEKMGFEKTTWKDNFYTKSYEPETLSKQLERDSQRKNSEIPGKCLRPDITSRIMEEERRNRELLHRGSNERAERIRKFNEWKNQ